MPVQWYFENSEKKSGAAVRYEGTARRSRWTPALHRGANQRPAEVPHSSERSLAGQEKADKQRRAATRCSCTGLHVRLQTHPQSEWGCGMVMQRCVESLSFAVNGKLNPCTMPNSLEGAVN